MDITTNIKPNLLIDALIFGMRKQGAAMSSDEGNDIIQRLNKCYESGFLSYTECLALGVLGLPFLKKLIEKNGINLETVNKPSLKFDMAQVHEELVKLIQRDGLFYSDYLL